MSRPSLLYYGDSPLGPSGFSRVAEGITGNLVDRWDITVYGLNHSEAYPDKKPFEDVNIVAPGESGGQQDPYAHRRFLRYLNELDDFPEVLMLVHDPFVLSHEIEMEGTRCPFIEHVVNRARSKDASVVTYTNVNAVPDPNWVQPLLEADRSVLYSNWARQSVESVLEDNDVFDVIYHGTSPEQFYPLEDDTIQALRNQALTDPDHFMVGYVGSNHVIKNIPRDVMGVFAEFYQRHPDSSLLLLTQPVARQNGWNLHAVKERLCREYGMPEYAIQFALVEGNAYMTDEMLNQLYNIVDAIYLPSMEGWGLPVTEASTCKTPTVVGNHATLGEVGSEGRSLQVNVPDDPGHRIAWPHDKGIMRSMISVPDAVEQFEKLYRMDSETEQKLVEEAYDWAMEHTWEQIADEWDELFQELLQKQ